MNDDISIKKKRVMSYFIEAAAKIMETDGVDTLTIRSVAAEAGYNSATMYNYFENLDELKEWAAIRCITPYFKECCNVLAERRNSLETLIGIWTIYCRYAFEKPQLYSYIFFSDQSENIQENLAQYSRIYPDWLGCDLENPRISRFVKSRSTRERCLYLVEMCIDEGYFRKEDQERLNNIAEILAAGILQLLYSEGQIVEKDIIEDALNTFQMYYKDYLRSRLIRPADGILD